MAESPEKGMENTKDGSDKSGPNNPDQGSQKLSQEANDGTKAPPAPNTADKHLPDMQIDDASAANKQNSGPPPRGAEQGAQAQPPPERGAQQDGPSTPPPDRSQPPPQQPDNPSQERTK
jgi:hypothetical protein